MFELFKRAAASVASAAAGKVRLFIDTDGLPYVKDEAGTVTPLKGDKGDTGATGAGVPIGGTTGQVLVKVSATDYDTTWDDVVLTETDPVFVASPSYGITNTNITNWDTAYGWGDHSTQGYATQTYVDTSISNLIDAAPATLDTLNELAAALGDDPNFATTVTTAIGTKWTQDNTKITNWDTAYSWGNHASAGYLTSYTETDPVVGAVSGLVKANGLGTISAAVAGTDYVAPAAIANMLETSDIGVTVQGYSAVLAATTASFTTADETKLDGIEAGAEVNVNADWNAVSGDAQILNKPTLATVATTGSYNDLSDKPTIPTAYTDSDVDTHLNTATATTNQVLSWTGTDYDWVDQSGGGASLDLYSENYDTTSTKPTGTGTNAVSIGISSTATNTRSFSVNGNATSLYSSAIGQNSGGNRAQAVTGSGAMALGGSYASGTDSFAAAIANNTSSYGATGANSVAMGASSKASGSRSLAVGYLTTASGFGSTSVGYQNNVTASYAVGIGQLVTASGQSSVSVGYYTVSNIIGKYAYSSGRFSVDGDAQTGTFVLRRSTTDATATVLTTDNTAPGTNDQVILPNNSAYAFSGIIVARQQASQGTASAAWKVEGLIRREGSAGTTVLVNSALTVIDNTPGWTLALSADTTNGGLKVEATGAASTNIRWVATIQTSEVTY